MELSRLIFAAALALSPGVVFAGKAAGDIENFCQTTVPRYVEMLNSDMAGPVLSALSREPSYKNLDSFQQSGFLRMLDLLKDEEDQDRAKLCTAWLNRSAESMDSRQIGSCKTFAEAVKETADLAIRSEKGAVELAKSLTASRESLRPAVTEIVIQARSLRRGVTTKNLAEAYYQECVKTVKE